MGLEILGRLDPIVEILKEEGQPDAAQSSCQQGAEQNQPLSRAGRCSWHLRVVDYPDVTAPEFGGDPRLLRALQEALVDLAVTLGVAGEDAVADAHLVHRQGFHFLGVELPGEAPLLGLRRQELGMSRALLKLSGSLVHDYATISDDSPSPNRASRARRAATSAGIS